jgi:tetratricopeptide (TPR) repeat protein
VTVSLGAHRLRPRKNATREESLQRSREMLFHALSLRTTVAVVGSGCSAPLGYPTWRGFATEVVDLTLEALGSGSSAPTDKAHLERVLRFKKRLGASPLLDSEEVMFFIGTCRKILDSRPYSEGSYLRYLQGRFQPPMREGEIEHSPHRALLYLPIYRFVTTNYDCELELALGRERGIAWKSFIGASRRGGGKGARLSFTQEMANFDQMACFALAGIDDAENMVFHCHGRYDEPEAIIATELDYQKWYLSERPAIAPVFLQTLDLLFNSNPILFVGYGLGDEDLLRPLRRIAAVTPEKREFRLLFALLPERSEGEDWDLHETLFERYGLNVLPFEVPTTDDPAAWGRAICAKLMQLEEGRLQWREKWFEKPKFRRVSVLVRPPEPYWHFKVHSQGNRTLGAEWVTREQSELREAALDGARVIGIVGPGGTGKSWHAMRLLESLTHEARAFESLFFWSSYYADDSVSGVDRLLEYIDAQGARRESRLTRLRGALARGRHLIVFDGFERLLRATSDPEMGASNDPIIRELLEVCSSLESQSTLILTSRLWPDDLKEDGKVIRKHTLSRMQTDDILRAEPFRRFTRDQASEICSLLAGHTYALLLAGGFLDLGPPSKLLPRYQDLRRALCEAHPDRRLACMIGLAIDAVDQRTGGLARPLLERLAVFMSPVTEPTVEVCCALAKESRPAEISEGLTARQVIEGLLTTQLVFAVTPGRSSSDVEGFTVHPTVRSYVFEQAHQIERDVLPNFTLAGLTSGRAAVHPGSSGTAKLVEHLYERLHERTREEVAKGQIGAATQLFRSLFGVVRSRMEANTATRWCSLERYLRFGVGLADLAKSLSLELWSFREPHEREEIEDPAAPLYADELAFVYNDVGLALCAEGCMHDSLAIWEQGYEINRILEGRAEVPLYSLQSQLHLGHVLLEKGDLRVASQYLQEAARTNHKVRDLDYGARILGYQALVAFYRGHLEEAEGLFEAAGAGLRAAGGNPRAESFFLNHRAKLAMELRRLNEAEAYVRSSRAVAEAGGAVDLVAYARANWGRLLREQGRTFEANAEYQLALSESCRLGIRRLECEILTGLARLALGAGDAELSRRRAMVALAIANELSLGLRRTQSLLVLGLATLRVGQPRLGVAYLRLAKKLGEAQEYRLRSREAEEQLIELGEGMEDV